MNKHTTKLVNLTRQLGGAVKMAIESGAIEEQKHLDIGTSERVYWHYGYGMAIRDILNNFTLLPKEKE